MKTPRTRLIGLLSVSAVLALTGCAGDAVANKDTTETEVIRIGTLPILDVEITDAPDYLGVVEAVRADHVDIALMSAFPSALAVNTGEVDALLAWPGSPDPVSTCYVLKDSPIEKVEDLKGATIGFADPGSSSGFFMPTHLLDSAGLKKDVDYEAMFTGGHDLSAIAVKEGQIDAACTATMLTKMIGSDYFPFEEGEVRFIGESIPMDISMAVIASQKMSDAKRQALVEALPKVFSPDNDDKLGVYAESGVTSAEPMIEPSEDAFASLVDVAAVADVDISDLK